MGGIREEKKQLYGLLFRWGKQIGFFRKDKGVFRRTDRREFVIMFVLTGMNGLSVFFRAINPQRGDI